MSFSASVGSWLAYSALVSLAVLTLGSCAVLLCRQPTRRLRIIELTMLGCLVAPCLGMIPAYPQWSVAWWDARPPVRDETVATPSTEPASLPLVFQTDAGTGSTANTPSQPIPQRTATPSASWDIASWLVAFYLFGAALGVAWWSAGVAALAWITWSAHVAPPRYRRLLAEIAGPESDRVRLLVSRRAKQPFAATGIAVQLPPERATWNRALIVLPHDLCDNDQAVRWALSHEWAHIEHHHFRAWFTAGLVRLLFFYQPLVWWLRRQLRLCQDFIADARAGREASEPEDYAEFLARRATAGSLHPAMAALGMGFRKPDLYRRVVMLVENPPPENRVPRFWNTLVSLAALLLIGLLPALTLTQESTAQETLKVPAWKSPLAKRVVFVAEPRHFSGKDKIVIQEVWSELGTLALGDTVRVKGTYTLASRRIATLLFSITHKSRDDPQGGCTMERQIRAGTVPFELELPVAVEGRLHIGFYDAQSRKCFGNVYFDPVATSADPETVEVPPKKSAAKRKTVFFTGPSYFSKGNEIKIEEVWSKRGTLTRRDIVRVKGYCTLTSDSVATLLYSVTQDTSKGPQGGCTMERPVRSGTTRFDLELPVTAHGRLHIGLYNVRGGRNFGNVYFGTRRQMMEISNWNLAKRMK